VGSAREAVKKKGYFNAFDKNTKAYAELFGKIMSAKAHLAELDKSTSGEVGISKKSKKAQEAAVANDQVAPVPQAEIKAELSSAQEATAEV
jgi:hypothetical protein